MPRFAAASALLRDAVARRVTPAAVAEVGSAEGPLWSEAFGGLAYEPGAPPARADTVFDLASLTKVIATATLAMRLAEAGLLRLDDRVADWVGCWRGESREEVRLADLLAHASGLPAWRPLYQRLAGRTAFEAAICGVPLEYPPRHRSVYSDLGFILLGLVLERAAGEPLDAQFDRLGSAAGWDLRFGIGEGQRERAAPTQRDPWRGRLLHGEVDDGNAAALGGVAGHSGVFGTAGGVGRFARAVLDGLSGAGQSLHLASRDWLERFTTRAGIVPGSSRALGWDTMLPTSSCGTRMSPGAFGHTGFTGTSLWIDPEAGVYVTLLTNRVHPAAGPAEPIQALRRALHDAVMEGIRG